MSGRVSAQEKLCDNSYEDCRAPIIQLIRNEKVGIDVSFWFMTDTRYSTEIIKRWQAGVPVRIILDTRADANYPANATVRKSLISAGIPIRTKVTPGINHWKVMIYAGQATMHFSAANFANGSYSPVIPYTNYVDEAIYFTDDPALVTSFQRKFDDIWIDTVNYQNVANVKVPLVRNYPVYPISADLNFPPDNDYQDRVVSGLKAETSRVDVIMFRITSNKIPDQLITMKKKGIPVRLITDQSQYRTTTYFWDAYNVDRMYMAGIPIKWKSLTSGQDVHEKAVLMYGKGVVAFGSSNATASSSDAQREHNYFAHKPWFLQWFVDQFERKWNNLTISGQPISPAPFQTFAPKYPETPVYSSPANTAAGIGTSVTLKWEGGWWAHQYDIYFGTASTPPLAVQNYAPGAATAGVSSAKESYTFTNLQPGVTYYWRIVGKTMANKTKTGATYSFTTAVGQMAPENARIVGDTYVRAGGSASGNFGRMSEVIVKYSAQPEYLREGYMTLDISALKAGGTATLRLFGHLSDTRASSVTTSVFPVASTTWSETGVTYNNRPAAGSTAIASVTVSGTTGRWYSINLTSYAQAQRAAGATRISIALKDKADTLPYVAFSARESTSRPQLVISP
jgi:phosphatidylserine/phosphatidylglycerophosphate/cardiolipin synthase-like enzyme